jgi:hypothetical protein
MSLTDRKTWSIMAILRFSYNRRGTSGAIAERLAASKLNALSGINTVGPRSHGK